LDHEAPPLKVQEETNTDGIIFLYWQQQQIYLSVSYNNSYLLWLYNLWNNNKNKLFLHFFGATWTLSPDPKDQNLQTHVCENLKTYIS
jgi:hypothetical protein